MIKKFGCKNIKAIREFSEIEIRPITIVMGENSSGKSSLLQALSLLSVNKMFGNDIRTIKYSNPFSNFDTVDTFKNKDENVELSFEIEDEKDKEVHQIKLFYIDDKESNEHGILNKIEIKNNKLYTILELTKEENYSINLEDVYFDSLKQLDKEIEIFTNLKIISKIKIHENYVSVNEKLDSANLLLKPMFNAIDILMTNLTSIRHVGMLKDVSASYDYPNDYIGYFGEKYKSVAKNLSTKKYINDSLKHIFEYEVKKIDKDTGDFYISDNEIKKSLKLNMFGSSVSSTIPILTQYAKNREPDIKDKYRLTIIEEPEINEHPLSQAKFIEALFPKTRPKNHYNIIETHSDHIVNKLRFLVSQKVIKSTDIVIYYKHKKSSEKIDKNRFYKIEIDKCGQFKSPEFGKGFPKGFFDATLDDLFMLGNDC